MKPVGGFFELELVRGPANYHSSAMPLNTARACMKFILNHSEPRKVYLPYYNCDASLMPFGGTSTKYEFYAIDEELNIAQLPRLLPGELLIYINYFGLKGAHVKSLLDMYGENLVVDNTQAFFEKGYWTGWSFNSARKFFGVPDGGFLYAPIPYEFDQIPRFDGFHFSHLVNRLTGKQQQSYREFLLYEESLGSNIERMSLLSEVLLSNIDYAEVAAKRKRNYLLYESAFKARNLFHFSPSEGEVPMFYPLLLDKELDKNILYRDQIFIPVFWQDTVRRNLPGFSWEKELSGKLLPLPIDHRYDENDCRRVADAILQLISW